LEEAFFHWKKRRTIGLQSQPSINIPESQVFNDVGQGFEWFNKQRKTSKP
jgi:hypothetical protein